MRLKLPSHPLVYGVAFALVIGASMAIDAIDPLASRDAAAQAEPTVIYTESDTTAPEGEYAVGPDGSKVAIDPSLAAATPAVPVDPTTGLVDTGDGLTTNLGGSDVAVSNVGGSHEIDGPKRKARRFPVPTPNP
jgi:hypothetical protein